jgi:acetyl-CoA acetyltransferase
MTVPIVVGVGMMPFGKHPERTVVDMGAEVARAALLDAGLAPGDIEFAFFSNVLAGRLFGDATIGQNVLWEVGINRIPVINVENACTSGSTGFMLACNAVAAGQAEAVMVVGSEKTVVPQLGLINSGQTELDTQLGLVAPAGFALRAQRHIAEYGTTLEQLALVAVKNRRHGSLNPVAQFRQPITVDEVLSAPMIVDPLTRLQCCPNADGAAAVIVTSPGRARKAGLRPRGRRWIGARATLLVTGSYENPQDLAHWDTDYRAAALAYERAGLGPSDIDLVECHDAFTIGEIIHCEALGLCAPGEGGLLVESGETELGGRVPVNVSGGLLSRGHPTGATGVAQVVEIVQQLRGEAGSRQVDGARIGLAQCMGGDKAGDTKSCTVAVLGR